MNSDLTELGPLPAEALGTFFEILIMKDSISITHVAERMQESRTTVQKNMQILKNKT